MSKHSGQGTASGDPGYQGRHRAGQQAGYALDGRSSTRMRTDLELLALEQQDTGRGDSKGRYDK
jgi:hypothetical protein